AGSRSGVRKRRAIFGHRLAGLSNSPLASQERHQSDGFIRLSRRRRHESAQLFNSTPRRQKPRKRASNTHGNARLTVETAIYLRSMDNRISEPAKESWVRSASVTPEIVEAALKGQARKIVDGGA